MLVRIWRVRIRPERFQELANFANTVSLPMFQKQPGCLGVLFTRRDDDCVTISFWGDVESIERLKSSPTYLETVRQIEATGLLQGEQSVEVFESLGGYLNPVLDS